ncbi:MAG: glutamate racemase, partial [Methylococcales bacterium]|nr:glutamate racemase [Methylococcales bacterium]
HSKHIGIFDSGVGGLSVLRHIHSHLPSENLIYLADQAHVPYGARSKQEIQHFCTGITRFLLEQRVKLIVVACNTATAAALDYLRETFPAVLFVGMEPAVKPAAAATRSKKVGVLATLSTFKSQRYADLMQRFANEIQVWEDPCRGLVELIENGRFATPDTKYLLKQVLRPMLTAAVDTFVLGCTHYPFVLPLIEEIIEEEGERGADAVHVTAVIDPAPAVVRQVAHLLLQNGLENVCENPGQVKLYTTAVPAPFQTLAQRLLQRQINAHSVVWQHDSLIIPA